MDYPVETSEATATGTVTTGNGKLLGGLLAAGGDAATATIYDNTAASGPVIRIVKALANESSLLGLPSGGVRFGTGLHVVLAGTAQKLYLDHT